MPSNNTAYDASSTAGNEKAEQKSGETSPAEGRSLFSGRARSNTESTVVSSTDTVVSPSVVSTELGGQLNSPVDGSIAVDEGVDADAVIDRVNTLTVSDVIVQGSQGSSKGDFREDPRREGVKESAVWEDEAIEWAGIGLRRLVQLAKDENERDPSKSVGQYYSEHLAEVIKDAGIEFDVSYLK